MIFKFLHRHLPPWSATLLTATVYLALVVAVALRWDSPSAPFRYIGL